MDFTDEEVKKLCLQPGDLLVCEGGEVGRTAIWEGQLPVVLYQNHIHRLRRRSDQIEPRFFMYWMQAAYQVFQHYQGAESRTAIPNLSGSRLKQFIVPLPPLEEQKRIVARIEELMTRIKEARKLRQESKEKTELLWQSALAETFPKPGTQLPNGWQWVKLGEVFRLKNGKFIRKNDLQSQGNIPVYGSNGLLGFITIPLLTEGRTIVIGRVGACGAINVVDAPCWISDNAMFVAKWFIECDIEYIALALRNVDFSSLAKKGAQPSISQEVIYNVLIPLPPLEEQKRIVAHLQALQEKIKSLKESQTHTETKLKELENSILDKAFKGEL
jgi:type I restriction enzyme S subunit